jgi:hypothetical protein
LERATFGKLRFLEKDAFGKGRFLEMDAFGKQRFWKRTFLEKVAIREECIKKIWEKRKKDLGTKVL